MLNNVAFVIAVLGTFVVAWQAYETHRTTTLSQRTLESNHSLAIDSARARLDQDAPRIDVYVEQVSMLPGAGLPGEPGETPAAGWRLPVDAGRLLSVERVQETDAKRAERPGHHRRDPANLLVQIHPSGFLRQAA